MPWTVDDVDRFKKGLDDKQKKRWVQIANGALDECMAQDDADELDCEVKAVRVANATVEGKEKAAAIEFANGPNPLRPGNHEEQIRLVFAEADTGSEYQLVFPIGLFKTSKYGELIITRRFADKIVENWKNGAMGKSNVFLDKNHDFGEAYAWAEDIVADAEGVKVKWRFNSAGRELIADERFKYYSAVIGWAVNLETGEEHYPILWCATLTNTPVMNVMPEAHLSNTVTTPAHGDGQNIHEEESMKTLAEILTALLALSDEERGKASPEELKQFTEAMGIEVGEPKDVAELQATINTEKEKVALLAKENREMSEQLATYKAGEQKANRDKVIEKALADGRILPKDREAWEGLYDKDPEGTEKLLSTKGKEIEYDKRGTSRGKESQAISPEEKATLDKLGLSEEDIATYGGDV